MVMIGDDEDEIPLDHIVALRSGLPDAQLAVVPAAGHELPLDRPELFTMLVTDFVTMTMWGAARHLTRADGGMS